MGKDLTGSKLLVVSAVNFSGGGPLTVLRESLASAVEVLPPEWEIMALVHDAKLIDLPRVRAVAIPDAKAAWWRRLRWEWFGFARLSKQWKADVWLSLHDITPRVSAGRQAVYCHNPAPFYRLSLRETMQEPKLWLFNLFYAWLYRLNIRRNSHVIVQQEWLRHEFRKRFGPLPMLVAHPAADQTPRTGILRETGRQVFLYAAFPRVFKNFEVIGEAVSLLVNRGVTEFEVRFTIDGSENRYAAWLKQRFGHLAQLRFIGLQPPDAMPDLYAEATVALFPSRLETWGLPITEAKGQGLPMLVADLPYAHETVGEYDLVSFFDPLSPDRLARLMEAIIGGTWQADGSTPTAPGGPFAANWDELWTMLVAEDAPASVQSSASEKANAA
ncbi:glycosyltransferase [Parerythrobacter aurantius]|uniref:glycosyltransferase n=1 Tax=Parerythrobacter aurantius TaxID=3127706 RepID=UPI003247FBE2